jgi:hypothetical protein
VVSWIRSCRKGLAHLEQFDAIVPYRFQQASEHVGSTGTEGRLASCKFRTKCSTGTSAPW